MNKLVLSVGAGALLIATAGCEPVPGQTNTNANQGAAVGAGVGLLAGVISGDNAAERRRNAVLGAAAGAALGAGAGALIDRQEAELRNSLGPNVGITNTGNSLVVSLPQDILFATDSAQLTGNLQNDLYAVARSMNNYPDSRVQVIGHTDNTGAASYNQQLSLARAQAVTSVLVSGGVSPGRISTYGQGENQPVASNATPDGRAQNRRVEIVITPN